ncbi:MAG: DUF748 domain-containing protein [bacterium]
MNRKKRRWLTGLSIFGILIIIVLLLIPPAAKYIFEKNSTAWVGRKATIEHFSINYLTSTFHIKDLRYYESDGQEVFLKFDTLDVDGEFWQLLRSRIVIENLYLSGLKINVVEQDTTFNFSDIIAHFSPDRSKREMDTVTAESGFLLEFSNLELANGSINYLDSVVNEETTIQDLNLFIPYLGWREEVDRASGLKFDFKNGGFIHLDADWERATKNLQASIHIDRLELVNFSGYLKKYVNLGSLDGLLNADLELRRPGIHMDSLGISGYLGIKNFHVTNDLGDTLGSLERLDFSINQVKPLQLDFLIDSLVIDKPYLNYVQYDSAHSSLSAFIKKGITRDSVESYDTTGSEPVRQKAEYHYQIDRFALKNGEITYADSSMEKPFDYRITELNIQSEAIDSELDRILINSGATLNGRGKLNAELNIDPKDPAELDLYYVITDFQLSDIDPYSDEYAGLPILYGNLYYKSETTIRDGLLNSKNELIIEGAEFGDQKAGITDLPIGLAMFFLKDKNGDITIDIPVKGDINDPEFSLRKFIYKSFSDLIGKIVASPFKILARTFQLDPKDIKDIKYDYLDAELTKKKKKQIEALLTLEQKKEDLGITLVYFNDVNKEKEAIATDMIGSKFNNRKRDYRKDKQAFAEYVRKKVKNDTMDVGQACLQLIDPAKADTLLKDLKNERFNSLREYLFSLTDSTRIELYVPDEDAQKNIGSKPVFEIKYSIRAEKKAKEDLEKLSEDDG